MSRLFLLSIALLVGCASTPPPVAGVAAPYSREEYDKIIDGHTVKSNTYSGIYQTFQADVTILSNEVLTATLRQRSYLIQSDEKAYQSQRQKVLEENSAYAKFFMRFYSPDKDYDDLNKPKTIWKLYLDFNGQRFEGKVTKLKDKFIELKTMYPYMDHFSTPYEITFNIPMSTVETGSSKVTLTSTLGTAEFSFPVHK